MTGFDRLSYQSRWLQVAPERKFLLWLLLMALAFTLPAWGQALTLALTAALTLTRRAPETDILIGGTVLTGAPVPIDQPAPMALAPVESAQPLSVSLTFESKSGDEVEVTVSDGVLIQPLYSLHEEFASYTVSGKVQLSWTIESPDEDAVYTLCLDGAPAAVLHYDAASGYWTAARA